MVGFIFWVAGFSPGKALLVSTSWKAGGCSGQRQSSNTCQEFNSWPFDFRTIMHHTYFAAMCLKFIMTGKVQKFSNGKN
jgi:hypothetical protein